MIVGITGHQKRRGIDWEWVADALQLQLARLCPQRALTSLAEGTDQLFAGISLQLKIPLVAVIPLDEYETFFSKRGLATYRSLLSQSTAVMLGWRGSPQQAFLNAGQYIVENCNVMFAVWDGKRADGLGGTADIVHYAIKRNRHIIHVNPCDRAVTLIERK